MTRRLTAALATARDPRVIVQRKSLWFLAQAIVILSLDGWIFDHVREPIAAAIGAVGLICLAIGAVGAASGVLEAASRDHENR